MVGDIFSLVLNFTLWNDVCMVHIIWIFINVFCSKFVFCRKLILHTFKVQWYIQTIVNLKTIVDHCPQNFENHRKTIDTNGWTLKKHSMVMVQRCQNHRKTIELNGGLKKTLTIPSLWKIDHRRGLVHSNLLCWFTPNATSQAESNALLIAKSTKVAFATCYNLIFMWSSSDL